LLEELVEHCRAAAAENLSEWHEIQALWLLGVEFEEAERFKDAARAYKRIVALRRAARQEATDGLPDALAAAAVCEFRAGNRKAGLKLANEVLQGDCERLSKKTLQFLKAEIGSATAPKRGARPKAGAVPNSRAADERHRCCATFNSFRNELLICRWRLRGKTSRQARSEIQHGHDHPCLGVFGAHLHRVSSRCSRPSCKP